jgi:hypothetical protein
MNKVIFCVLIGVIATGMSLAQSSAQASGSASQGGTVSVDQLGAQTQSGAAANASGKAAGNTAGGDQVQAGSIIYAELDKSVDAKKAKVGDQVVAKVQQAVLSRGKVVAAKGSRIMGHVTQVKARTKDQPESELGLAFDHIVLKDGSQIPVSMTIQAIGSGRTTADLTQDTGPSMAGPMSNPGAPGRPGNNTGVIGGAAGTVDDVTRSAGNTAGTVAETAGATTGQVGASTSTHVSASSHGVIGMPDLTLSAGANSSTQASVISSDKKNVKLDSGSELVLRVQ